MKKTYKLILVAIATSLAFTSCSDELFSGENGYSQSEGSRVIAVSFGPQTRTALGDDGLTPEFTGEDEWIRVSNSFMSENCKVVYQNGRASITTSLSGALTAVYPASAAQMDGGRISGIDIPSYQDGTFASANICMAEMEDEKEESLTFHNKTALFAITPLEGTAQLKVTSLRPVGNDGTRSGYALPISTGQDFDAITITTTGKDSDGKVYLSLCPGVNLSDLSFEAEFATKGTGSIKGIPMNAIEEAKAANATASGTIYTINESNWHEYVTINGVKWATMNVGASLPEQQGYYFSWGNTEGHWLNGTDDGYVFGESQYESTAGAYVSTDITGNVNYDAASDNWGGAWRMPAIEELRTLISLTTKEPVTDYNSTGMAGYIFSDGGNSLFFPKAVAVYESGWCDDGGYYWSSTYNPLSSGFSPCLYFDSGCYEEAADCYLGLPVRAIVNDGDSRMKKIIWENDGTHDPVSWNGVYRFSNEKQTTGEEIYAIPMGEWDNVIKGGTFYLLGRKNADAPNVRVTTGWWSTNWLGEENIAIRNDVYTDNGDGTFLVEIHFTEDDPIFNLLDGQHLLFTGDGYTPLELYYYAAPLKPAPREHVLWKGEAYADDFTNQPSFLDNYGQDLLKAGAKAGQEVRFYITPIDEQWKFEIVEGHWGWVMPWSELTADERNEKMIYRSYCSPGHEDTEGKYVEWDLNAHGGYVPLTLTQEMLTVMLYPNKDVDWGGTFIGNGDNVIVTKITLLSEEN